MKKFVILAVVLLSVLLIGFVLSKKPQNNFENNSEIQPTISTQKILKGFQLSPRSYIGAGFTEFFELNNELGGNAVGWTGTVQELNNTSSAPYVVLSLGKQYTYTPIITVQTYLRESGELRTDFVSGKSTIIEFVKKYKPEYFGMGVEVNLHYEKNQKEYNKFVILFNEYAQEIHTVSPETKVFTTFQLEHMKGMQGGLFGKTNDSSQAQWLLIEPLTQADVFAYTSYPTLIYKSPEEIPNDYYTAIYAKTPAPIIFTELGWIRTRDITGWEGSDTEQEKFLEVFDTQVNKDKTKAILWSFLYDPDTAKPFSGMGFRGKSIKKDDPLSPAEMFWQKMYN